MERLFIINRIVFPSHFARKATLLSAFATYILFGLLLPEAKPSGLRMVGVVLLVVCYGGVIFSFCYYIVNLLPTQNFARGGMGSIAPL